MILQGDALEKLKTLPGESVQCCITSPPYWGLRDYGVEGQLGLEPTLSEFIENMVAVFREVRRVLRPDGTLWLNIGDSYASAGRDRAVEQSVRKSTLRGGIATQKQSIRQIRKVGEGLKRKDLIGVPWELAFALRADGWWLRQDIIWNKPNPTPESINDRCTKAHEYIFLLSKSERYLFNIDAIKEQVSGGAHSRGNGLNAKIKTPSGWDTGEGNHKGLVGRYKPKQNQSFSKSVTDLVEKRNKRSVWTVATRPSPYSHFATYPEELITPCVLAGSNPGDTILDPFSGTGTTGVAAKIHSREYIGIELKKEYADFSEKRLGAFLI